MQYWLIRTAGDVLIRCRWRIEFRLTPPHIRMFYCVFVVCLQMFSRSADRIFHTKQWKGLTTHTCREARARLIPSLQIEVDFAYVYLALLNCELLFESSQRSYWQANMPQSCLQPILQGGFVDLGYQYGYIPSICCVLRKVLRGRCSGKFEKLF